MHTRRKFSAEFKREAVELTDQPGQTLSGVARDLGIRANLLGRWRRGLSAHGAKAFGGQGIARDQELMALRRELAPVKKERDFFKKRSGLLREGRPVRYRCVAEQRDEYPVLMMCRLLEARPGGFYAWLRRRESRRAIDNRRYRKQIAALHAESDGVYGSLWVANF